MSPTNIAKLLDKYEDKTAYVQNVISYCTKENFKKPVLFVGHTEGKIVEPKGEN